MFFSIILPLYNKSNYIQKAINSVLDQTYKNFEIIIVDDGSTDNGLEIIEQYTKSINQQIKIIKQSNQGVSVARNNGVQHAKYEYIAFLDADDWWEPTFLEEMKNLINLHPNAALWASHYYIVKQQYKYPAPIILDSIEKIQVLDYYQVYSQNLCMPVWTGAVILKKNTFLSLGGFNPGIKLGEDFLLWLKLSFIGQFYFFNVPLSNYNQDVDTSSRAIGQNKIYNKTEHYVFHLDEYRLIEKENHKLNVLLDKMRVSALMRYYRKSMYKEEINQILASINWQYIDKTYCFLYRLTPFFANFYFNLLSFLSIIKKKFKNG